MKILKISISTCLLTLISLLNHPAFGQATVYNSFGAGHNGWNYFYQYGDPITGSNVYTTYSYELAYGFQSSFEGVVKDIWLAISMVPDGPEADTVIIRLTDNPNGLPPDTNDILEEWTLTEFEPSYQWTPPVHLIGNGTTKLFNGQSYWLWALGKDSTWCIWSPSDDPLFTTQFTIRFDGDWFYITEGTSTAFRIDIEVNTDILEGFNDNYGNNILYQNYPNPVYNNTYIKYSLEKPEYVILKIFDIYGKEIQTVVNRFQDKGDYNINFIASRLKTGIYYYSLEVENKLIDVKKFSKQNFTN